MNQGSSDKSNNGKSQMRNYLAKSCKLVTGNHTQHIPLHHFPISNPSFGPDDFASDVILNVPPPPPFTQPQPRFQTTTISHQDHVIGSQWIPLDAHSFLLLAHPSQSVHQSVARGIFQKSNSITCTYFISDFCLAPFGDTPLSLG